MAAVRTGGAQYVDSAEMREWLAGEHVAELTDGAWPTAATAELWRRFRAEATGASAPRWNLDVVRRRVACAQLPAPGTYRVELATRRNRHGC